jgi:5-methyltetrahydropteroyltriglutamate--homocysteine methyltransferase
MSVLGLLPDKEILVGAIDVATTTVETPEQVADTLRRAAEFVDPERIIACTNCGMALLPRDVSEAKLRALGAGPRLFWEELGG